VILPVASGINNMDIPGTGMITVNSGGNIMAVTLPGINVPGARYSNIINTVGSTPIGDPCEGSSIIRTKGGRNTQTELNKGPVKEGAIGVFALAEPTTAHRVRHSGAQASVGVHKQHDIWLTRQPA